MAGKSPTPGTESLPKADAALSFGELRWSTSPERKRQTSLRLWDGDVFCDLQVHLFFFKFLASPGNGCVWTMAVRTGEGLQWTVVRWVVLCCTFCARQSAVTRVCAVPTPLTLEVAWPVRYVGSDRAAHEACVD